MWECKITVMETFEKDWLATLSNGCVTIYEVTGKTESQAYETMLRHLTKMPVDFIHALKNGNKFRLTPSEVENKPYWTP